jgi:orotate phosphoribosyltransferase
VATTSMTRHDEIREKALKDLQQYEVLMLNGHFDFGNGYHGRVYLNPHQLFRYPSTIWRFAQDLLDIIPASVVESTEVVAGPVTGGALLAHTMAGLLDSRRDLRRPPTLFAPFADDGNGGHSLSSFYGKQIAGRRVLLADDVRNTGQTFAQCAALVRDAGGTVVATCEIYDRLEADVEIGVPNFALAGYRAPENYKAESCPLCQAGTPISSF